MEYEAVIGLEVHAQLLTESKIFCGCSTKFGAPPNTHVCPVCLGMPGVLPVLNQRVVEFTIRARFLATNCAVQPKSVWARKNYFYPDLPKNYQISQYELPLCLGGWLDIEVEGQTKRIGITPHPHGRGRGQAGARPRPAGELRGLQPHRRAADGDRQRAGPALPGRGGGPISGPCATSWSTWRSATATWRRAPSAATPT